jgi:hypothetical protein
MLSVVIIMLSAYMLSVVMLSVFMFSVKMLLVIMLSVFMLSVIMLNVVAPISACLMKQKKAFLNKIFGHNIFKQ